MKHHLKITRHNNQVYRNNNQELLTKINELEDKLLKTKTAIEDGRDDIILMEKKMIEMNQLVSDLENCNRTDAELKIAQQEIKRCNEDLDIVAKKSLQCHSKSASNQRIIHELKTNQTKLTMKLDSVDADLFISKQETKKCSQDFDAEIEKGLRCQSENDFNLETILNLKKNQTKLISDQARSQREFNTCREELDSMTKRTLLCESNRKADKTEFSEDIQNEVQKRQNLEAENSNLIKAVEALTKENDESEIKIEKLEERVDDLKLEYEVMQQQNEDSISNLEKVERERNVTTWMISVLLELSELTCHGTNQKLLKSSIDEKEQCVKRALDYAREGIVSIMFYYVKNFSVRWYNQIKSDNEYRKLKTIS